MDETKVVSAKIPGEVYKEMALRVPEGNRSDFLRVAIMEKLEKIPRPDKIFDLEKRMDRIENELAIIKKYLAELEVLTYGQEKSNPHTFGIDETDHKLIDYLIHYKGATTPELANHLRTNRWLVLNRLRRIQRASRRQHGKPVVEYYPGERSGKKKAWWLNEELAEI